MNSMAMKANLKQIEADLINVRVLNSSALSEVFHKKYY